MTLSFVRMFFAVLSAVVGYYTGAIIQRPVEGTIMGLSAALILIIVERRMQRVSVRGLSSMVFGLLLGVFMAKLISDILSLIPLDIYIISISRVILTLIFSYLGTVMALRGKDEFNLIIPYVRFKRHEVQGSVILLDTSAIIDGRIAAVYKTHFLEGRLVVPRFVLEELQRLADSGEDLKRQRGRRGLELLHNMQEDPKMDLRIQEEDFPEEQSVDMKLNRLAKLIDAKICTTDFNLNRMASLQGIEILNLNELVNAVKQELMVGDKVEVKFVKEGKEHSQAIAFLDDGTMIVVSDAREFIGEKKTVVVTSSLQTNAGKMIFAKLEK